MIILQCCHFRLASKAQIEIKLECEKLFYFLVLKGSSQQMRMTQMWYHWKGVAELSVIGSTCQ
jgi:hypothetical protein